MEKKAIIMGIHVKFGHAAAMGLKKMLYRAAYGKDVLDLVDNVIECCKECATWKRKLTRPQVKAMLAEHFNCRVQTDPFFIFDKTFIVLVDECIR
eukprot:5402494-Pyramimonas_sp.AAC.1